MLTYDLIVSSYTHQLNIKPKVVVSTYEQLDAIETKGNIHYKICSYIILVPKHSIISSMEKLM